jgi:ABC-2 type transport system ATP-binding protein
MDSILQLNGIVKSYGRIRALKNVSFEVPAGAVFGILGPNGSGKTTLLSIILDVLKADQGQFFWFGESGGPEIRKKIGSLLETPNFYHYLSAIKNLRITRAISGRGTEEAINEVLQTVKLYDRRFSRFSSYSLGMKQRLAVGAALLGNPKVLVLDEPTNGLDPVGIAEIRSLILELRQKGHTIIMASHLLDEVEKICSHMAILNKGELITAGAVEEVLAGEDQVEISSADLDALAAAMTGFNEGAKPVRIGNSIQLSFPHGYANPEEINRYCFSRGIVLNHLMIRKKKLEAKFFELTQS